MIWEIVDTVTLTTYNNLLTLNPKLRANFVRYCNGLNWCFQEVIGKSSILWMTWKFYPIKYNIWDLRGWYNMFNNEALLHQIVKYFLRVI